MTDNGTVATYREIFDEHCDRHSNRSAVSGSVDRFLSAVEDAIDSEIARLLDVECGPGWESSAFSGSELDVLGVDLVTGYLRVVGSEAPGLCSSGWSCVVSCYVSSR